MFYPYLFSPISIGSMLLPNRVLMGSMHLGYEGRSDAAERMAEFYAARARGGAALIITGGCAINEEAIGGGNFSCIYKAGDLSTLALITRRVHQAGGKIGLQLFHAGRYASKEWLAADVQPVAPSAIRSPLHSGTPRAMSESDIHRTVSDFAGAALSAKEAGFDCVEVMGSEGYLINQFLSPVTNKREDRFGGPIENRARFGVEVMRAIRESCGPDYAVIYRMSGIDLIPESNGWEETFYFAQSVEEAGASALNIGIGWHESRIPTISMLVPRAYFSFAGERIRQRVRIPCIASNRINDPEVAEELLSTGKADLVSIARALLADPEFARKASSGKSAYINTCIACNQACLDNAFRNEPTACILNPEAGRELEIQKRPALHRKRVAVVGAGPAGLEVAKTLSERGHHVTLFERQNQLGGQLNHAAMIPGKEEFLNTIRYYTSYLQEYGVRMEMGASPSATDLRKFDTAVIATGAKPREPDIEGANQTHCMSYEEFFQNPSCVPENRNVVVIGAGGIGCDVAHLLVDSKLSYPRQSFFDDPNHVSAYEEHLRSLPRVRFVTLMRRGRRIGEKLGPTTRWALLQLLENRGVKMLTQIQYRAIQREGVITESRTGKEVFIPADFIIFAIGQIPENSLYTQIRHEMEECYLIGAAKLASETNAQAAIWEAAELGRRI